MDADLVLEGGGVKGIGLVGAFSTLVDHDYTFHRIAGTSAGAIVGALIAAGMPPEDLQRVMRTVDYGHFQDEGFVDHLGLVGKGISILFEKGIYEGRYLVEWLDGILMDLGARTFGDLRIEDPNSSLPHRAGLQARHHDLRRHPRQAGAAAVGLPEVRVGPGRTTGRRRRARLDVDPVLLRAAAVLRPRRSGRTGPLVHGRRRHALELPDRGVRPNGREAAAVAHVRDQALGEAVGPELQRFEVEGSAGSGARDGGHDDELPRPDAHRRSGRPGAHDVRRHRAREGHRLRHRRTLAGHAVHERGARRREVPVGVGFRALRRGVPQRRPRSTSRPNTPGSTPAEPDASIGPG